jgi:hypothetical protein
VRRFLPFLCLFGASAAQAYETDQVTDRGADLPDVADFANGEVNELLDGVVRDVNTRTGCEESEERTRMLLAKEIDHAFAAHQLIWDRGPIAMWGYGRYSASLETGPARLDFNDRRDIYGDLGFFQAVILKTAGVSSTVRIGDVRLGTDKLHHFFSEGYLYFKRSHWGEEPDGIASWGTMTERTRWGLWSSLVFSFADLHANYEGFQFYDSLLASDSVLGLDDKGCVARTRSWEWRDIIDPAYDEFHNPSIYTKKVERSVEAHLAAHKDAICADYRLGFYPDPDLSVDPLNVQGKAPARIDPFKIAALCADTIPIAPPPDPVEAAAEAAMAPAP